MSESDRVQRWREAQRQKGLKACTVWLTPTEELRLKDLAAQRHCSPSAIMQEALAQYQPAKQSSISNVSDTELFRDMIRAEIGAMQAASTPNTATVTDTEQLRALIQEELAQAPPVTTLVTDTVTDTVAATLPALVRTIVEELALEALGMPATDTENGYVTDTDDYEQTPESLNADVADTNSNVTETATPAAAPTRRKGGRPTTIRPRILDLLHAHPEGLTAIEVKVLLHLDKNIGDTLAGMVRDALLTKQGTGAQVRYRVVGAPPAPPAAPVPHRRTNRAAARA